jgi:UDP-N-acetylmuramoyl-L-alanyl-D-glutamate--2,6-diaminopimelate ligase
MNLERLVEVLAPREIVGSGSPSVEVRDLAYDARRVEEGSLFFCYPGARADGHDFAGLAVESGAVALVVERPVDASVPQVVVHDARAAMAPAADVFFGRPSAELRIAGVTGTNGKTTTAFLLHSILSGAGLRPGLVTTIETRVGDEQWAAVRTTPEAIDLQRTFRAMLTAGNRSCAMEATSHGSSLRRLDAVRFAALAFTNLNQDHLDFHGTMDEYYDAKRRLFIEGRPPAAVNVDDDYGRRLAAELRSLGHEPLLTFGFGPGAEVRPDELELGSDGARLRVAGLEVQTSLRGRFNVENVLAAVAVSRLLGIPDEAVAAGVESLPGVPGRLEPVDEGQPFAVLVDYSHKPDALENALVAARELASGRVLCVFGCGGERDRGKRPVMGRIASTLADVAIVTSDNPRGEDPNAIIDEVLAGAEGDVEVEPDRSRAIVRALEQAERGDVVVIAGKGHERGQEIRGRVLPFDDREIAREALRSLVGQT